MVGAHLLIAQGDQGAGDGRLGLGVNHLAVIGFGGAGGGRLGLAFNNLTFWGWGRAGDGFLGLAVSGQRHAGQNQDPHQDEHGHTEFLLHASLLQAATSPARPEYFFPANVPRIMAPRVFV